MNDTNLIDAIAQHKMDISFSHDGFDDCIRVVALNPKTGELLGCHEQVGGDFGKAVRLAVCAMTRAVQSLPANLVEQAG